MPGFGNAYDNVSAHQFYDTDPGRDVPGIGDALGPRRFYVPPAWSGAAVEGRAAHRRVLPYTNDTRDSAGLRRAWPTASDAGGPTPLTNATIGSLYNWDTGK